MLRAARVFYTGVNVLFCYTFIEVFPPPVTVKKIQSVISPRWRHSG